jgi:ribosomal protein L9
MAHKLGAFHHLPHGVANALMIEEVLRFNASEAPAKMGTFSQYDHPHTLARYAEIADYLGLGGKTDEEKLENLIKAINELKNKEASRQYKIDEDRKAAKALADRIKDKEIEIKMGHGADGRLYGSVTTKDIATELSKMLGVEIDKRKISIKENIKAYGKYDVEIKLLSDIGAKFIVYVHE